MKRVVTVAGLVLLLLLLFSFSNRIAEFTRLTAQEDIESGRIFELQQTEAYLDEQIAFTTSEAAVEEWAREEARMAQDGDFPVIPLNPDGVGASSADKQTSTGSPESNFQAWLEWFFFKGP